MLEREGIPYIALDLDPDRVRQAAAAGSPVVFGDAVRLQALIAAGLVRASAVVVTYLDTASALKVLANTRTHAPTVPIIVRTVDDRDLEKLKAGGATEVVPEAIEGSLMLASHALALVGVPMRRVIRVVQDQRDERYNLLRGYFRGADDDTADELEQERLSTVTLVTGLSSVGQTLGDMALQMVDVRVVSLRRSNGKTLKALDDISLEGGDTLVLSGKPEALALAEQKLLDG
jgi:CPA2 family monovalent cation:H+ antiporter-2